VAIQPVEYLTIVILFFQPCLSFPGLFSHDLNHIAQFYPQGPGRITVANGYFDMVARTASIGQPLAFFYIGKSVAE